MREILFLWGSVLLGIRWRVAGENCTCRITLFISLLQTDKDAANMERLIKEIKSAGGRLGCFTKDKFENDFCAG